MAEAAKLVVAVVDDHHDVLPVLQAAARRGVLPFPAGAVGGAVLVHFDSHPDLCAGRALSEAVVRHGRPDDVCEALDESDAGIAEWIAPALYTGLLQRCVWVRPPWAQQLPLGQWELCLGFQNRTLAIAAHGQQFDYFVDDACEREVDTQDEDDEDGGEDDEKDPDTDTDSDPSRCCHSCGGLQDCHQATLHVVKPQNASPMLSRKSLGAGGGAGADAGDCWVLDICLDYFAVANPFLEALPDASEAASIQQVTAALCAALHGAERREWWARLRDLHLQDDPGEQVAVLEALLSRIGSAPCTDARAETETDAATAATTAAAAARIQAAGMSLIAQEDSNVDNFVEFVQLSGCLPHGRDPADTEVLLTLFESSLRRCELRPSVVTICRSDGYTPEERVEPLLERVVRIIEAVYGTESCTVHDLGSDARRQAYGLFLSNKQRAQLQLHAVSAAAQTT